MNFQTIPEMFFQSVDGKPDHYAYYEKVDGEWKGLTYQQVGELVNRLAAGLASLGVKKDDKVAILSANNPRWAISDYAITGLGAITVSIYPTLIPSQIKYIIDDSDSLYVITENQEQADKVLSFINDSPGLKGIIAMDETHDPDRHIHGFNEILTAGDQYINANNFSLREASKAVQPDDLLTLIYTSGTTGNPKGVMLTHKNLCSNIISGRKAIDISAEDVFLSFLPLSHSFERMVGHFTAFSANSTVYYAESIDTVADNMGEVRPTVMTSVPRLYEKMYARVLEKVSNDPPLRQKIFWWAIGVGRQAAKYFQRSQKPTGWLGVKLGLADKLVFSKIKQRVGGRLRFFVSGGAPLSKEIGEFFAAAGIAILEGYGLTETSPVITVNRQSFFKFGTVGPPVDGVEVKIAEDGEILCRGDNVMKGYYKSPEATAEVLEEDGWFHTGDIGEFDEDGYLRITDRKKNLLVTSGGKNVAPSPMENVLVTSKFIEQCLVIGDKRKFISALIVPAFETLKEWAQAQGIAIDDIKALLENPQVKELYDGVVEEAMQNFSQYERVKKYLLVPDEWTIESGELTPTLKVKRKVVEANYAAEIEAMYAE
jgi:long-chain acyl-CoA synthetase